jgi:hypothetical protein
MFDWSDDEPLRQMMATEDFTQHWSPEERGSFLLDWNDDEPLLKFVVARKDRSRTMALRRARLKITLQ